ncbi:MAG: class I tRNA ligase family protein [Clostridiaceae bacterium]|jgi:methionyl-tRNA synthetase|nr:class I tRNA ligase family protein [Clostridiaceae bacterium]
MDLKNENIELSRPVFPKRAVVTAGMPYGNKGLHLGHVGGVFVHADAFARFLRDRIGKDNVIFISGTDCYGSPISENYRQLVEKGEFEGTIEEFVQYYHEDQKRVLGEYNISLNLYAASGLGRSKEIHREMSKWFIENLYKNKHLRKMTTSQFYDTEYNVLLNGRQVVGQCPIDGCQSDKGYADECSLGHQYMPQDLINPKSTLSGKRPAMVDVTNWYFNLNEFHDLLKQWVEQLKEIPGYRNFVITSIEEFLEPPVIYIKKDQLEALEAIKDKLPPYEFQNEENKSSALMIFDSLELREKACTILAEHTIRFRTGKTLVPFRLTGNIDWGVPAPNLEGLEGLTIWVWPESLWAPLSFTKTYLEKIGRDPEDWKTYWCSKEAKVFQFIGEDNVYFYGPVEMAMFMGQQGENPTAYPEDGQMQLPLLIVNNHLLFLNKKASSSGKIKPPSAEELLNHYTAEQLRAHFLGLGLGIRSVGFQPKPFNPNATERDADPVLKEGNLLSNVFNRAVRSCFYTVQKYFDGKIPLRRISEEVLSEANKTVLEYEQLMSRFEFHQVMNLLDVYIRNINKYWSKYIRIAETENDAELRAQTLVDTFHMVKTAAVLMHPIAPEGTEMIREYLNIDESLWSWDNIFKTLYELMPDPENHVFKFLEPRVDFFKKHPSQINKEE